MAKRPEMTIPLTILVVTLAAVDGRINRKLLNEVDMIRDTTLNYIDELWVNITDNTEWMFNAQKSHGSDSAMLLAYKTICDRIDRFVPPPIPSNVAENIWNYARIQVELTGINGLYGNFRKYQQEPPHRHKSFQRAWEDLAETVLQDSDTIPSIPSSLESTHGLITGDGRQSEPSLYGIMGEVGTLFKTCLVKYKNIGVVQNLIDIVLTLFFQSKF